MTSDAEDQWQWPTDSVAFWIVSTISYGALAGFLIEPAPVLALVAAWFSGLAAGWGLMVGYRHAATALITHLTRLDSQENPDDK